jgi:RNA-directed DNA polymerase
MMSKSNSTLESRNNTPDERQLIERVVERKNLVEAYSRVVGNKGSVGIDKMTVEDLKPYLQKNWPRIKEELLNGTYQPKPVRRIDIPKPGGGTRQLGVPTVMDRLIQQALNQVLTPMFDPHFSKSSYGFRPGKSAHQAILQAKEYQLKGKVWVVDMDLEKFFDEVNHDILMSRVARKVKDKKVLLLIRRYLNSGIMVNGITSIQDKGTPQGGPLSPLLSNILLDDLDKELEKRGHCFCRYADDSNIYVRTQKAGERVLSSVTNFVEKKLKLKVNKAKSAVGRCSERKFLGYSFTWNKIPRIRVPKETIQKLHRKLKPIFSSGKGRNLERFIQEDLNKILKGWINYFSLSETLKFSEDIDGWIRRRLRLILWRQWKRRWTRRNRLMARGLSEEQARVSSFNRHGPWWNSGATHMNQAHPKKYFDHLGLVSLNDELLRFRAIGLRNRLGT